MLRTDLKAQGDRDLAEQLLKDRDVRHALEKFETDAQDGGARRQLLATAMRLTPEMAPDVHETMETCRAALGLELPVETYVYPSPMFNAAAVRPEHGLLFVLVSSSLLEAFEAGELRFVVGHELAHHLFEHHKIPVGALLGGEMPVNPSLALQLFAWQRYAEISADRAGLACAGSLEPAAHALFKLASGLRGGRIHVRIDRFLSQAADFRQEVERESSSGASVRADWFATHPFSPLRLRAVELASRSEFMLPGGMKRAALEAEVQELMTLMDPSYLQEDSSGAEAMRRLLFAGAILIATTRSEPDAKALAKLDQLLGPGSVPFTINRDAIREDLPSRIERVRELVRPLRWGQIIRDLSVIARADQKMSDAELQVIRDIAKALGVDESLVTSTTSADPKLD
jgi:hypothetical protein